MAPFRTDLAEESHDQYRQSHRGDPDGVVLRRYRKGELSVTDLRILNKAGAKALGKPCGRYLTVQSKSPVLSDSTWIHAAANTMAVLLRQLVPESGTVLVLGLGNRNITPDRLGSAVMDYLIVTRHLISAMPDAFGGMRPVCALAPGVLGVTGIETAEIARAVVDAVRPAAVIAVDALAAADQRRLCSSFQFSDTGISPGSGAGNHRTGLNQETLGVPVIAAGVPTVIDRGEGEHSLLMTPKDIDLIVDKCARILGYAVDLALQGEMTPAELESYLCC